MGLNSRDGTLVGYIFSKRYKKVSPHRKSHNLLYNLLREKNKPSSEMGNKRGVPIGPTWLIRALDRIMLCYCFTRSIYSSKISLLELAIAHSLKDLL